MGRVVTGISPVGLDKHAVDLLEVDGAGLVADGLDEGAYAEVASAAQEAITGTHDEGESFWSKCVVAEASAVELVEEEGFDGFGSEARQEGGVGDARGDVLVDGEG